MALRAEWSRASKHGRRRNSLLAEQWPDVLAEIKFPKSN